MVDNENEKKLIKSGKKYFYCGYSPERVNPGDNSHQLEKIVKIVSACTKESFNLVNYLYRSIIKAGTYKAESIQIAEATNSILCFLVVWDAWGQSGYEDKPDVTLNRKRRSF